MAKETVSKRCCLCFEKSKKDGDDLIWKDSLQLCQKCYDKYMESAYNQRVMMLNSIRCYRRLIRQYEESSNVKFDTKFEGIS